MMVRPEYHQRESYLEQRVADTEMLRDHYEKR